MNAKQTKKDKIYVYVKVSSAIAVIFQIRKLAGFCKLIIKLYFI